jgi:5-formyltetrahydrofolate cyclo-ligase
MPKRSIRDDLLARRRHLADATCLGSSIRAQRRLLESAEFAAAASLALYSSIHNEVFTEEILSAARRRGMQVSYPRVHGATLEFVEVREGCELAPGAFGVLEPTGSLVVPLPSVDLVVVPGVAFDYAGHRLGYGKGFYDRVLHDCAGRATKIGLCFDFQLLPALPAEKHDVCMDLVITEERLLRFAPDAQHQHQPKPVRRVGL